MNMSTFQLTSAKFSQRTLLVIVPMTLVAYIVGSLAEYEQNVGMYGSFTTLSGFLGWVSAQAILHSNSPVFYLQIIATSHISCNETVRHFIGQVKRRLCLCRASKKEGEVKEK